MEVHLLDLEGRNRIKVSVNGRQTEVYEGLTILQALAAKVDQLTSCLIGSWITCRRKHAGASG